MKCIHRTSIQKTHTCYHAEFGSSATNGVCISSKALGHRGTNPRVGGVADPSKQAPSPYVLPCQIL